MLPDDWRRAGGDGDDGAPARGPVAARAQGFRIGVHYDPDAFGRFSEAIARFLGTGRFLVGQTVVVARLDHASTWSRSRLRWDPYPFILLNLAFSTQAAYAAPLILLAQNRQDDRDRAQAELDREVNARTQADTEYLARELASVRLALADVVTSEDLRDAVEQVTRALDGLHERLDRHRGRPDRPFVTRRRVRARRLARGRRPCSPPRAGSTLDGPAPPAADDHRADHDRPTHRTPTPPPDQATVPDLRWRSCGDGIECAEVAVPLDHDEPGGPTTTLAVVRIPAREPDERVGALFVNPGGPGGSATSMARALAGGPARRHRRPLRHRRVRPARRRRPGRRWPARTGSPRCTTPTRRSRTPPTERRLLATSRSFIGTCTEDRLDLLAHAGTEDAADDMDLLRRALGDEQISYLGYSYGTSIGQVYADRFPDRVRAMVLDGVVDLAEPGVAGAEEAGGRLRAGARALQRLVRRRRRLPDRPPSDRRHRRRSPRPPSASRSRQAAPSRRAGPGEVTLAMAQALYSRAAGPTWPRRCDDARSGDGTGLVRLADSYIGTADFGAYFAVNCLDARWPDVDGMLAAAEAGERGRAALRRGPRQRLRPLQPLARAARSRAAAVDAVRICRRSSSSARSGTRRRPTSRASRSPTTWPTGVLLTYEGDGHTIAFSGSDCIDDAVVRYLVELVPPGDGTRCPA